MLLYEFIDRYREEILQTLEQDQEAKRQQLVLHFTNICSSMSENL